MATKKLQETVIEEASAPAAEVVKPKTVKAKAPKEKKAEVKMIKVTLVKSTIACLKNQKANVEALGLRKIGSSKTFKDDAVVRGMIRKVSHLVKVEEI